METKKVVKVQENGKKSYKLSDGTEMFCHVINIEGDATDWVYHSKDKECKKFTPQEMATFTTEVKQNGQYTNYKISPVEQKKQFGGGGFKGTPQQPRDQGAIQAMSCVSSAVNFYQQRQGTEEEVMAFAEKIFQWVSSKSNTK